MTADGAHLLWNGCKVTILLLKYMCSHSCAACAGSCMQVSTFREDCLQSTVICMINENDDCKEL